MGKKLKSIRKLAKLIKSSAAPSADEFPTHIGNRRRSSWWEPVYGPDIVMSAEPYDWDLGRDAGPHRRFVAGVTLKRRLPPGEIYFVRKVTFRECDFQGAFRGDPIVMFEDCQFINCDFAYSSWVGAHFKECKFSDSSLSLASFERCEFRDCVWERIGVASRTEFSKSFISDPRAFIRATISRVNPTDRSGKHRRYQAYRLSGTRAHVLRSIMLSHAAVGDEHVYYSSVRLHELQRCGARIAESCYEIIHETLGRRVRSMLRLPLQLVDYALMRLLGLTNQWGDSVGWPCILLILVFVTFGISYEILPYAVEIQRPFQKSFDITLLVGYGNQASEDPRLSFVQSIHVTFSVLLYTVFLSTMISKLSRAR